MRKSSSPKALLATIGRWCLVLAILAFVFHTSVASNRTAVDRLLSDGPDWGLVAVSLAAVTIATLLGFLRWFLILQAQRIPISLTASVRLGFLGLLFTYITPGALTGDLVRGAVATRGQSSKVAVVTSSLLDRLFALYSFVLVIAVTAGLLWNSESPLLKQIAVTSWVGLALGTIVGTILLRLDQRVWSRFDGLPLIGSVIGEVATALRTLGRRGGTLVVVVMVSVASQLAAVGAFFTSVLAVGGFAPSFIQQTHAVSVATVGASLVPTPGGMGAFEGACVYLCGIHAGQVSRDGNAPSDWKPALEASLRDQGGREDRKLVEQAVDGDQAGSALFGGDTRRVAWSAYRRGQMTRARSTVFLAAVLFRVLSVLVIGVGSAICVLAARSGPPVGRDRLEVETESDEAIRRAA